MFSFLKKTKIKKAQSAGNDNKENNVYDNPPPPPPSSSTTTDVSPEAPGDVCPPNEKIRVQTDDKLVYDYPSSDASPRDLSSSSLPPKAGLPHTMGAPSSLSQLGRSDLSRVLTSGYLNAGENMGYMKRAGHERTVSPAKSLQFHQPVGFSYNRTQTFTVPGTKKGMKALVTGSTKIRKVHCSTPPSVTSTPNHESTTDEEPIVLSRYSGGFIPDPDAPKKIESMDWPAPIALQAVPELMKPHRSHSESRSHHSDTLSDTIEHEMPVESLAPNDADADADDNELRHDEKLEKDISEMSKIKESSGMAHALLEDLRIQEKIISRQLPLDPWKASRSPSAAIEPPRRCRFESPTFASPSRRVHTHSSSTTNQDDSLAGLSASIFTTPAGGKRTPLARYQQRSETLVLRPDDSLSPSPKNQTLSNRPDIQRSCDLESTTNSSFSNDGEQNKSSKTVNVDATSTQSRHAHSTHSAPALMSNPKIYAYDELRVLAKKRLPSDVDRDHLERHLADDDFHRLFEMTRMEYYRLPEWRRVDLKKRLKLF